MRVVTVCNGVSAPRTIISNREIPDPGEGEILVKVMAVSLNARDLRFYDGTHPACPKAPMIPCSDMAGEVVALGPNSGQFKVGMRVMNLFLPKWIYGRPASNALKPAFGGPNDGVACDYKIFQKDELLPVPDGLSYAQASCLPCAGVTAWNALLPANGNLKSGNTVIIHGSGGVATFAVQFATSIGAIPLVLSKSDDRIERMKKLGAQYGINYKNIPEWGSAILNVTDGRGADLIITAGKKNDIENAICAISAGGTISLLGDATNQTFLMSAMSLVMKAAYFRGIAAGNREMMLDMCQAMTTGSIMPVIDSYYPLEEIDLAFMALMNGGHIGKICLML